MCVLGNGLFIPSICIIACRTKLTKFACFKLNIKVACVTRHRSFMAQRKKIMTIN